MKVYFVRHCRSILNDISYQFPDTPLSPSGLEQAEAIAKRFATIPLDLILTSPYKRALQTAQAIERVKKVPLLKNELLVERRMPAEFRGKSLQDPKILSIHKKIKERYFDPEWRYADEENFSDHYKRVASAIGLIQSQKKESIAVVTHGYFLTLLIYFIVFGLKADPKAFRTFRENTEYSNTGLTLCEYTEKKWKLITWNDLAHLGE